MFGFCEGESPGTVVLRCKVENEEQSQPRDPEFTYGKSPDLHIGNYHIPSAHFSP